jgi:hypothetical protein
MKISSTGMPRVLPHVDLALLPVHRPPGIDRIHAKPAMTYRVTRNCLFSQCHLSVPVEHPVVGSCHLFSGQINDTEHAVLA